MNELSDYTKTEIIRKIIHSKFQGFQEWKKPVVHDLIGPYDPTDFDNYTMLLDRSIKSARQRLHGYSKDELCAKFIINGRANSESLPEWREFLENDINRLLRTLPLWFQCGFGSEEHKADFDYWSKMQYFTLDETTCLTIGFEPKFFNEKVFNSCIEEKYKFRNIPEFFFKRREQINRKFELFYSNSRVRFDELFEWIKTVDLDVTSDLIISFQTIVDRRTGKQKVRVSEKFDNREKIAIAKLLVAMAIDHYGYDPKAARSPIPKEIQDMCATLGLSISDDTVRKYLKLGARYLPDNWRSE